MHFLVSHSESGIHDSQGLNHTAHMGIMCLGFQLKVNCLIKRGSMHLQATMLNECVEDFKKAISLDPDNSDIYHHRGQVFFYRLSFQLEICQCYF